MKSKKTWIIKYIIIAVLYAVVIHILFSLQTENRWLVAKWSAGEILTYTSTVSLGLLAVWQNRKIKEDNEKAQQRLERISIQSNELNAINRIIDYESNNLYRLRTAFDRFSIACDPQKISSICAEQCNDYDAQVIALSNARKEIEDSYFAIARELRIDLSIKENGQSPVSKNVSAYYLASIKTIEDIIHNPIRIEEAISKLGTVRDQYVDIREKYLVRQELLLDKAVYGTLSLDEIKKLYQSERHVQLTNNCNTTNTSK